MSLNIYKYVNYADDKITDYSACTYFSVENTCINCNFWSGDFLKINNVIYDKKDDLNSPILDLKFNFILDEISKFNYFVYNSKSKSILVDKSSLNMFEPGIHVIQRYDLNYNYSQAKFKINGKNGFADWNGVVVNMPKELLIGEEVGIDLAEMVINIKELENQFSKFSTFTQNKLFTLPTNSGDLDTNHKGVVSRCGDFSISLKSQDPLTQNSSSYISIKIVKSSRDLTKNYRDTGHIVTLLFSPSHHSLGKSKSKKGSMIMYRNGSSSEENSTFYLITRYISAKEFKKNIESKNLDANNTILAFSFLEDPLSTDFHFVISK